MRLLVALFLAAAISLSDSIPLQLSRPVARAQETPPLPPLGAVVVETALNGDGPFRPRTCPTGRNRVAFVDSGLEINVTGRCNETSTGTATSVSAIGFSATNGELSIDVKVVEGYERAWFGISFREQGNGDLYFVSVVPSRKFVELGKGVGSIRAVIAERTNVDVMTPDAWVRIGVRFEGPRIWVLVNDEPVLSATDSTLARGGFGIAAGRIGDVDDDAPAAVIWRNLRVTALSNEAAASSPQRTTPPAAPGAFVPAAGEPPTPGRVIYGEPLTGRSIIPPGSCRTGRGRGEIVGEGFLLAVRGKCTDASTGASVSPTLTGLMVPDGEVRFEFKVTGGYERSSMILGMRNVSDPSGSYLFGLIPGRGIAYISKTAAGEPATRLGNRADLGGLLRRDDWNTMSVRVDGSRLWLLINDQTVLSAEDGAYPTGGVWIGLARLDNPDDEDEVAVVYRNFSVSAIEGAPDDRAPTYVRPSPRPAGPGSDLSRHRWPAHGPL